MLDQCVIAPMFATIQHFVKQTGLSRATVYRALARGDLRGRKVGRRTMVDMQSAREWFENSPLATFAPLPESHRS